MKNTNRKINVLKRALTFIFAIVLTLTIALSVTTHAKSTFTFDGKDITTEAFGDELPTNDRVFLTRDFILKEDYVIPANNQARIYLNGHNIDLNGHQIKIAGSLIIYEDNTNPTFYSLDNSGNVIEGNDHVVNGGLITGATSDYAIVVDGSNADFYLRGGNVFGNAAGGIKVNQGKVFINSGTVSANKAATGAGIYLANSNCQLTVTNGVIEYNTATSSGAGIYQNGIMTVSSSPIVRNNKLTSGTNSNVYIPSTNTSNAKIRVSGSLTGYIGITTTSEIFTSNFGYYNNATGTNVGDYFFSDDSSKYVVSNGQTGNSQEGKISSTEPTHTHDSITFTKWTNTKSLPTTAGSYYLSSDIELTNNYNVSSEITICLNGHSINLNGYMIELEDSANFTIRDCSKEVHYYDVDSTGLGVLGGNNHKFYGGYIYGGTTNRAINSDASTATFSMYGGALFGNTGGAIKFNRYSTGSLKFSFYDAYIVGNTTEKAPTTLREGSAIYAGNHNGFTLSNTVIQYNKTYTYSGAVWTAGEVTTQTKIKVSRATVITDNRDIDGNLCNLYIDRQKGHTIDIPSSLENSTGDYRVAKIGITSTTDSYFTNNFGDRYPYAKPTDYFFSDKGEYVLYIQTYTDNVYNTGEHREVSLKAGHTHDTTSFTNGVTGLTLTATSTSERYFYFKNNIKLTSDWTVPTGSRINICLNGYSLDLNGHTIIVPSSSKVRFYDCSNFRSKYYINSNGLAVVDNKLGTTLFNHSYIYDSTCLAGTATNAFFKVTGGTLELEDVNVFGAYTNNTGNTSVNGAIYVSNGTFTMTKGMIAGCKSKFGAALHLLDPDYPTTLKAKATFTNVKIQDNSGSNGAIYAYYGQLTMTDCYLINNKATDSGGAISSNVGVKATISYSYFYNNTASYYGGALYAYNSSDFKITNCEFAYNKAKSRGGAIYNTSYMTLTSVVCAYNEATGDGGAIYYSGSGCYLTIQTKLLIVNNKSSSTGGGIYLNANLSIKDEIIVKNNTANGKTSNVTFGADYFEDNKQMYLANKLTGNTYIGVNSKNSGTVTISYGESHSTTAPSTYFKVDEEEASVELKNSEVYYNAPHYHTITYSASGNTLTAKCSECNEVVATIKVNSVTATYDKTAHGVIVDMDDFVEKTGVTPTLTYTYSGGNSYYSSSAPTNAGSYQVSIAIKINGSNYYVNSSVKINKKTVTVTGATASAKEYDGTTTATVSTSNVTFNGLISGDKLSITATGVFSNANAGTNKSVTISFGSLSGSSVNNYTLDTSNSQKTTTANITVRTVKVSNLTASNKEYDGTTTVTINTSNLTFDRKISGDTLSVTATGTFSSANAGDNISVTISNLTLIGSSKDNYTLDVTNSQKTTKASITKKAVIVTGIMSANKVYDGTTTLDIRYTQVKITGLVGSDSVGVEAEAELPSPNYSPDAITVTITSITLTGSKSGNYTVDMENSQKTFKVMMQQRIIQVTGIKANNKTYDGTTDVTFDYSEVEIANLVEGDVLTVIAEGAFIDYNVSKDITVNISKITPSGDAASNYSSSLKGSQKTATANISPRKVKVSGIKANDKVYDGTIDVTFNYDDVAFDNLVEGDSLTVIANGSFIDASYGTNKKVSITKITLDGASKDNYQLSSTGNQEWTSASITKDQLIYSASSFEGTYDGESHSITISVTPTNATIKYSENGIDYSTTKPEFVNAGTYTIYYLLECENYETINDSASVVINKKQVTVSGITANDKEYDGNTGMTLNFDNVIINGLIDGDILTVSASGAIYSPTGMDAGNNKVVSISNLALVGDKKDNYKLDTTNSQHETTASITKKRITISNIIANDKYYDGTTDVELNLDNVIYDGILYLEELSLTLDASFADALSEENKVVTLTNLKLTGNYAKNYYITSDSQTEAFATIFKALMECTITGYEGTYDKEAHTIEITDTLDDVVITYATSENGEYKSDIVSYTNAGTYTIFYKVEKENYETINGSAKVIINKKEVTVSGIKANDKVYDGNTNVELDLTNVTISGALSGDNLTVSVNGEFVDKNAGSNKKVNLTDLTLSNVNYTISSSSQKEATASITAKKIVITSIKVLDKTYDKTTDAIIDYDNIVIEGLVGNDKVTITAKANFTDSESGNDKEVIISDISLDGLDKANYEIEINQLSSSANILKAKSRGLNGGAIAGIVIAIVVVIAGASVGAVLFVKKRSVKA